MNIRLFFFYSLLLLKYFLTFSCEMIIFIVYIHMEYLLIFSCFIAIYSFHSYEKFFNFLHMR